MKVKAIYINTYKYDFQVAKICIASIRYWYPDIPVYLIKDTTAGDFNTTDAEEKWGVSIFKTSRTKFGWGYGKLEPLFENTDDSFLILDADTVLTGPVLQQAENVHESFLVDEEIQPEERQNQIYYNLQRINEVDKKFIYPEYSFNSGQWFGTAGILNRKDFDCVLEWTEPPKPKFPYILFNGEQGILNFILQLKQQQGAASVQRKKIMIWPDAGKANFIELEAIRKKETRFPYVIHWAGMRFNSLRNLPRADILSFYRDFYYTKFNIIQKYIDGVQFQLLHLQKKLNNRVRSINRILHK